MKAARILVSLNRQRYEKAEGYEVILRVDGPVHVPATCTVVICTHNRPEQLERCLAAVARLSYRPFEVMVVDNAPSDDAARDVAIRWGVKYIVEPEIGASRARNRGARACTTEIVAFLDDDAVPEPEWLWSFAREFEDPRVMAVGGRIIGLVVETRAEHFFDGIGGFDCGLERRVVDRDTPAWFELANFGGLGNGNLAIRRRAFDDWPGFHEGLGPGTPLMLGEEHHAIFSLIARGHRAVYTPFAIVRHPYPRNMQELRTRLTRRVIAATGYMSLMLVEERHYRWPTVKYALEALWGRTRKWRGQQLPISHFGVLSPWRWIMASCSGPLLYVRSRFRRVPQGQGNLLAATSQISGGSRNLRARPATFPDSPHAPVSTRRSSSLD